MASQTKKVCKEFKDAKKTFAEVKYNEWKNSKLLLEDDEKLFCYSKENPKL